MTVDMFPVLSPTIESVGYDPDKRELYVRFCGGNTYIYPGAERGESMSSCGDKAEPGTEARPGSALGDKLRRLAARVDDLRVGTPGGRVLRGCGVIIVDDRVIFRTTSAMPDDDADRLAMKMGLKLHHAAGTVG